ncbi:MAG: ComF family protein [Vampirovibrionales bacterium]|nr:ComF family protein [Vampirovibrionales bacterium]
MVVTLEGLWDKGFAYDVHTVNSAHLGLNEYGHDMFETQRTPMGELVYQLKYKGRREVAREIVELLIRGIGGLDTVNVIIPCPATRTRPFQAVEEIAQELGRRCQRPVTKALINSGHSQIKDIEDPAERQKCLLESIQLAGDFDFSGQKALLLDDLYQTGSTLSVATSLLKAHTNVHRVFALTMTKTRR